MLVNWHDLIQTRGDDVDILFSSFYSKFNKILNKHAPMKTLSKRQLTKLSKPWITKGIRISIKIKNQLFLSGDYTKYKHYQNMLCKLTCLSKKEYYLNYFNENFTNVKKTWEGINSLLNRKKNKNETINTIKTRGSNTTTNNK